MIAFGACTSENVPEEIIPNDQADIMLTNETRAAAENLKDFYVDFTTDAVRYVDSSNKTETGNVIVSPLSACMVLSMIANGVEGDVRKEVETFLGVTDMSALNSLANILLSELPRADNLSDLKIANAIWVNNQYKLTQAFSGLMAQDYQAEIRYENFVGNSSKALNGINSWCSDKTGGLIKEMLDQLDPQSLAVLLNAIYFKGVWANKAFLKENTKVKTFHGVSGDSEVDMMCTVGERRKYSADEHFEAFSIDFGNTAFSLMVVLPKESVSVTEANGLLTSKKFSKLENEMRLENLTVYLPKFQLESRLKLNDILSQGKLSGLTERLTFNMFDPASTGEVDYRQSSSLEIDESGAKLAAATSGEIIYGALDNPNPEIRIEVNRPFYFFLKEKSTGACLLSGRLTDL